MQARGKGNQDSRGRVLLLNLDDGRTGERVTPHISKPGWEYLEINEITVREKKTTCRRGNFDSSEDGSGSYQEYLARKVK